MPGKLATCSLSLRRFAYLASIGPLERISTSSMKVNNACANARKVSIEAWSIIHDSTHNVGKAGGVANQEARRALGEEAVVSGEGVL